MVGKLYQIPTFFVNYFSKREWVSKKSVFQQGCTKGVPFHTSSSEIGRPRNQKNNFCGKMELFTHILDAR